MSGRWWVVGGLLWAQVLFQLLNVLYPLRPVAPWGYCASGQRYVRLSYVDKAWSTDSLCVRNYNTRAGKSLCMGGVE